MSDDRILAELVALRAGQDQLGADLAGVRAEIDRLEAGQARLQASLDKMRGDIMARIDRLSETVSFMRDDIRVNFGTSDSIERAHQHTREELSDWKRLVADVRRQVFNLSERVAALELKAP